MQNQNLDQLMEELDEMLDDTGDFDYQKRNNLQSVKNNIKNAERYLGGYKQNLVATATEKFADLEALKIYFTVIESIVEKDGSLQGTRKHTDIYLECQTIADLAELNYAISTHSTDLVINRKTNRVVGFISQ